MKPVHTIDLTAILKSEQKWDKENKKKKKIQTKKKEKEKRRDS